MSIPIISQLPQQAETAVLLILLVLAFVIAFRIMKMVFETILVSVLSAGFYAALSQIVGYQFSFNQMLTYAFLGASLYMGYAFLASAYYIVEKVISVPYKIIKILMIPFEKAYSEIKEEYKLKKMRKETSKQNSGEEDGSSTKEVVIDKLKNDKDD